MTKEQITTEWIRSLSKGERGIARRFVCHMDFLVMGDAMSFIEEVAPAYGYNIVYVKLQNLDDLRGKPIVKRSEKSGLRYHEFEVEWENAVESSDMKSLVIFNIDEADDRLVNALKSIVERHGDRYFVGLICTDKTRDLKRTTTYALVKPVIHYDC